MSQPSQAGLNPPYDNGAVLVYGSKEIAVHNGGIIRPFSHNSSRRIGILASALFRHRVMIYHRIHVTRRDKKSQTRLSKHLNAFGVLPVRLGDNSHLVTMRLQKSGDDGMTKRRMIHIGVSRHIHKITLLPPSDTHILSAYWQKIRLHSLTPFKTSK